MRNPLRDEGAAFQLVLLALAAFGLIALASWVATWLGIVVTASLVLAAAEALRRALRGRPRRSPADQKRPVAADGGASALADGPRCVLVVLTTAVEDDEATLERALEHLRGGDEARVVVAALDTASSVWSASREADASRAESRARAAVARLQAAGVTASGTPGPLDVVRAAAEAARGLSLTGVVVPTSLDPGAAAALGAAARVPFV